MNKAPWDKVLASAVREDTEKQTSQFSRERQEIQIPPKITPADYVSNITIKISISQLGNDYCMPSDQHFLANFQFELEKQNQDNFFQKRTWGGDVI